MINIKLDLIFSIYDQLQLYIFSIIFWTGLYIIANQSLNLSHLPKKSEYDIKNRIISVAHGLTAFYLSLYSIIYNQDQLDGKNTNFQNFIFIQSAGYFFYDTFAMIYYNIHDKGILIHHVVVQISYLVSIVYQYGGTESLWALIFAEVTNWSMNFRLIVKQLGLKHTKLYQFLEYHFISFYIVSRGICVPVYVYHCIISQFFPFILKILCIGLSAQSIYYIFV
ncbi:hypothetical protein IMG5_071070, partial [Ichthyophthirius multifiliis]